ncbi:hypothetical protein [Acidiphilium sp.]|uniref:hypothetical protein n=1 Tax=Acidiphilium sp. TaxID=527 RepID=UPI003D012DB6
MPETGISHERPPARSVEPVEGLVRGGSAPRPDRSGAGIGAARGFLKAVALGIAFWIVVALVVVWLVR